MKPIQSIFWCKKWDRGPSLLLPTLPLPKQGVRHFEATALPSPYYYFSLPMLAISPALCARLGTGLYQAISLATPNLKCHLYHIFNLHICLYIFMGSTFSFDVCIYFHIGTATVTRQKMFSYLSRLLFYTVWSFVNAFLFKITFTVEREKMVAWNMDVLCTFCLPVIDHNPYPKIVYSTVS